MPVTVRTAGGSTTPKPSSSRQLEILLSIDVHQGPTTGGTRVQPRRGSGSRRATTSSSPRTGLWGFRALRHPGRAGPKRAESDLCDAGSALGHGVFEVCNAAGCSPLTGASVSFTYYRAGTAGRRAHLRRASRSSRRRRVRRHKRHGTRDGRGVSFGAARSPASSPTPKRRWARATRGRGGDPAREHGRVGPHQGDDRGRTASGPRFRYKRARRPLPAGLRLGPPEARLPCRGKLPPPTEGRA